MIPTDKWYVIINPTSGLGKAAKKWEAIQAKLRTSDIDFDFVFTKQIDHGIELSKQAVEAGYRQLICVGGDGHLQNVANGVMLQTVVPTQEVTIAMISMGTGNDWIKSYNVPYNFENAIELIKTGKPFLQDVGVAKSFNNGKEQVRYFTNFAGVGFDAYVVERTLALKQYGQAAYLIGLLKCLVNYQKPTLRISTATETIETKSYLTIAGIGKYGGGGMKLTPGANGDSGNFYVSIAKDLSKWEVVFNILKLYDGSYVHLDKVETLFADQIKIEVIHSPIPVFMEADGEVLGSGPFDISLVPKALRMLIG